MDAESQNHDRQPEVAEEPPPLFKSWSTWYLVVFLNLVFLIILFTIFTRVFS